MMFNKPMLASDVGDLTKIRFPVLCSPKLDGIRCMVVNGVAKTRSMKDQPNKIIREALSREEYTGFDGELMIHGVSFQKTTSAVMSHDSIPIGVKFFVFDDFCYNSIFSKRINNATIRISSIQKTDLPIPIELVKHELIHNVEQLTAYETACLDCGYEGVMIRDINGAYKQGRSSVKEGGLLKFKRFADAEATIIGFEEKMTNANEGFTNELGRTARSTAKAGMVPAGVLGAFLLERPDGVQFYCGSGLTDELRSNYWFDQNMLLGKTVKYKYQVCGTKDKPRMPIFLGLRDQRDL